MPRLRRSMFGALVYILGTGSQFVVVELLKAVGSTGDAVQFLQLQAIALVLSALFEFGVPPRILWSMLSDSNRGTSLHFREGSPTQPGGKLHFGGVAQLYLETLRDQYTLLTGCGHLLAAMVLGGTAIAIGAKSLSPAAVLGCIPLLSVSFVARKVTASVLEGARDFLYCRLITHGPAMTLVGAVLTVGALNVHIAHLGLYSTVALAILNLAAVWWSWPRALEAMDRWADQAGAGEYAGGGTTARSWHALTVAGTVSQQITLIIAPTASWGSTLTVPIYYFQRASQVAQEAIAQVFREWTAHSKSIICHADNHATNLLLKLGILGLLLSSAAPMAGLGITEVSRTTSLLTSTLIAVLCIDSYVGCCTVIAGHAALVLGARLPTQMHIVNSALVALFTYILAGPLGPLAIPVSALAAGLLASYTANSMNLAHTLRNIYRVRADAPKENFG